MVVRPEQVVENRCRIWEEIIDAQLLEHNWNQSLECEVRLSTTSPVLEELLNRYRDIGWGACITSVDEGRTTTNIRFELHDTWGMRGDQKLRPYEEGVVFPV